MLLPKSCKYFLIFTLVCISACKYWQNSANSNRSNTPNNTPEIAEIVSNIPFLTKEPEVYSAEIITKNEGEEEKTFIARSNGRFFTRSGDTGTLQTELNKSFLINFAQKIYVENTGKTSAKNSESGETLNDYLMTEWLNQKTEAKFESLGAENGLSKFRTSFEASETLIFVDENFKIPVRQEFYSIEGEAKTLTYSIELQNIKLIADDSLFEIPKDFRKVSIEEFRKSND